MMVAQVQTLVLTWIDTLDLAYCFPDPFQSMFTHNTFHLCLHIFSNSVAVQKHLGKLDCFYRPVLAV